MNLFAVAGSRPGLEPLLVGAESKLLQSDLAALEQCHAGVLSQLARRRVALCSSDPWWLARAMLLLDGVCEQILLLPPEVDDITREAFLEASATESVVSDEVVDCQLPVVRFQPEDGSLPQRDAITTWILPTSGTTGVPKLVRHTLSSLIRTVRRSHGTEAATWGLCYQLHRFAGLQVFFQAVCGGGTLVVPPPTASLAQQMDFFRQTGVAALSGTPTLWRKILMTDTAGLELKQITLGGEIVSQGILDALIQRFPEARITHIYASTELGVGFSVSDGRAGFPAAWLDDPTRGLRIAEEDGELFCAVPPDTLQWQGSGDLVEVVGERVHFKGRSNGSINVGGNKVMPEEVEEVLLACSGVTLAAVFPLKSSLTGQLVSAEVVIDRSVVSDPMLFRREILRHCRERLVGYKVPAMISFVDDLAVSPAGKVVRKGDRG